MEKPNRSDNVNTNGDSGEKKPPFVSSFSLIAATQRDVTWQDAIGQSHTFRLIPTTALFHWYMEQHTHQPRLCSVLMRSKCLCECVLMLCPNSFTIPFFTI